jgi:heme/copper-type cytochrome/quinol oxidase subunit 3
VSDRLPTDGSSRNADSRSAPPQINAGEIGMVVFIAILTVGFGATIVLYLFMRHMHKPWPPADFPALPASLWLSTLDIVCTSITVQGAVLAARRNDTTGLRRNLVATLILALGFLGLQSYAWYTIWREMSAVAGGIGSSYLTMFYIMTGLHAAHVIGGLVPLVIVTGNAYKGLYSSKKTAGVRFTAIYWHFLDIVWCVIFVVVYLM